MGNRIFLTCYTGYGLDAEDPGDMQELKRHVLCLDRTSGRMLWDEQVEAKLPEQPYAGMMALHGYASSTPAADSERVYVFFGKTELVVPVRDQLVGFDPASGERLWSCAGLEGYVCASVVAHDGIIYIGGRTAMLAVRAGGHGDVTESHGLWKVNRPAVIPSPVYHDGYLYFIRSQSVVAYCLDAVTGKTVCQRRFTPSPKLMYASPVLADGKLYYVSRQDGTFVLAAQPGFEQLAHNDLGDTSVFNASPAVAGGGRLLLRSNPFLYGIGTRH